ncbi:hypothetical protein ACLKA7_005354 [Drosophila subpalustris]
MDWAWMPPESLKSQAPPRCEPYIEPVNGIVQPPVMPPPNRPGRRTNVLDSLKSALGIIWKSRLSYYFRYPVDAVRLGIPDYHKVIRYPMDLATIRQRLQNNYYWQADEAMDDFELIIDNCLEFNEEGTEVHAAGKELREAFHQRLDLIDMTNEVEIVPQAATRKRKAEATSEECSTQHKVKLEEQEEPDPEHSDSNSEPEDSESESDAESESESDSAPEPFTESDSEPEQEPFLEFPPFSEPDFTPVFKPASKPSPLTDLEQWQLQTQFLLESQLYFIEQSHCEYLLRVLTKRKRAHHNWPFNNWRHWRIYGQNEDYYTAELQKLDWRILGQKLAKNHFDGFEHFVLTVRQMFEDALNCFPDDELLTDAVNETDEVLESYLDECRESIDDMTDALYEEADYLLNEHCINRHNINEHKLQNTITNDELLTDAVNETDEVLESYLDECRESIGEMTDALYEEADYLLNEPQVGYICKNKKKDSRKISR